MQTMQPFRKVANISGIIVFFSAYADSFLFFSFSRLWALFPLTLYCHVAFFSETSVFLFSK